MANPVVFMDITIGGAAAGRLTFEVSGGGCSPAALEPVRRGAAEAPACDGSPWLSVPSSGYWSVPVSVSASIVMQRSVSACLPACLPVCRCLLPFLFSVLWRALYVSLGMAHPSILLARGHPVS
jgi:hypothetical protein